MGTVDDNISNKNGANNVVLPPLPTKLQIETKQELLKESLLSRHGHGVVLLNSPSNTEEEEEGGITLIEENTPNNNKKLKQKITKGGKIEKKKKIMPTSVKSSPSNLQSSPIISTSVNFSASQGTIANTSIFSDIDLREETGIIKLNKKVFFFCYVSGNFRFLEILRISGTERA